MVLFTTYICYLLQTLKALPDDLNRLSTGIDTDFDDSDLDFTVIEYSPERKPKFKEKKAVKIDELMEPLIDV